MARTRRAAVPIARHLLVEIFSSETPLNSNQGPHFNHDGVSATDRFENAVFFRFRLLPHSHLKPLLLFFSVFFPWRIFFALAGIKPAF